MITLALAFIFLNARADTWRCQQNGETIYLTRPCPGGVRLDPDRDAANQDAKAKARLNAEVSAADSKEREQIRQQQKHVETCQRFTDDIARQNVWLNSTSDYARASAKTEIDILSRKARENGCSGY